jgi:fibronectin type 3 domain-containing protein
VSGASFPLTLNPGQTTTLNVQFKPATTGAMSGQLTIASTALSKGSAVVSLSGTGAQSESEVQLTWIAPSSPSDPIAGYKVYRAASGSSSFQLLSSSVDTQTDYLDSTGDSGTTYQYYVTSVDAAGAESVPSNTASVTIP